MKAHELFMNDDQAYFKVGTIVSAAVFRFTGSGNISGTLEVETVGALDGKRYRPLRDRSDTIQTANGHVVTYAKFSIDKNTTVKVVDVPPQVAGAEPPMRWLDIMHGIAQGAINISEGITTIEADSHVHRSMLALCERFAAIENGKEGLPPQWRNAAAHLAGYEEE